jgi:hypothetical protein
MANLPLIIVLYTHMDPILLGSLPNYALDAVMMTTSTKLANLFYQMQITGYMFKNAEYRMSLTKSLKGLWIVKR